MSRAIKCKYCDRLDTATISSTVHYVGAPPVINTRMYDAAPDTRQRCTLIDDAHRRTNRENNKERKQAKRKGRLGSRCKTPPSHLGFYTSRARPDSRSRPALHVQKSPLGTVRFQGSSGSGEDSARGTSVASTPLTRTAEPLPVDVACGCIVDKAVSSTLWTARRTSSASRDGALQLVSSAHGPREVSTP
ncbi:hypothetical protein BKA93DRAFT_822520 [Sparassis latifolia]